MTSRKILVSTVLAVTTLLPVSCVTKQTATLSGASRIEVEDIDRHAVVLASDEFQGRKPFTEGETRTVEYLAAEFEKLGFEGGNDGEFFQEVPLVEIDGTCSPVMTLHTTAGRLELNRFEEFLASTRRITERVDIVKSRLVFAGYGIVAPEYGWNDYDGLDVAGKTVLVLVNDPGFTTRDPALFRGNAMTYYGRWTYKYEEAARQGATGVIVIHETGAAGYPWTVLKNGAASADLVLQADDKNVLFCALEGWVTTDAARRIFEAAGLEFDAAARSAARREFHAMDLHMSVTVTIENDLRFDTSKNVLAVLHGSSRPDECVVYTSHWDHLGIGPAVNGDRIYNGAADNALPLACMLGTAKAFASHPERPARSVLFAAVTAEETGLLGSAYYVQNPVFALEKTAANLNYELFLPLGRMKDVTVYGAGQSELEEYVAEAATAQGRYVTPEPFPENGMYFRTDHFSFAKAGVPALFFKGWTEHAEHGKDWTSEEIQKFWATRYHRPNDEYHSATADLTGIVDDARLFFEVGLRIANEESFPEWHEGSEFKSIREKSMSKRR